MEINEKIIQLHEDLIGFGSNIQAKSAKRMEEKIHINENIYIVLNKSMAYAITLHRAMKSLCEDGWAHVSPILLRTLLESSANCLAVDKDEYPEYMAFKFLYHPYVKSLRENRTSDELREEARREIALGLEKISNEEEIAKAEEFISWDRIPIFWFQPEKNSVTSIINEYGGEEMKFIYKILSSSVHAGHFGMFLFREDSDDININPAENPKKAEFVLMASNRYLLEFYNIRNQTEGLEFDEEYQDFLDRILSLETEIRG